MARRTHSHPWADHPNLLTSIRSPWEHFRKVDWNFSRYENATFARPCDAEAVVYTALDYAISVVSLRDWTRRSLIQAKRAAGLLFPADFPNAADFNSWVRTRIPWQPAVEAIANTAKHGEYRDEGWSDGTAMPATFVPENLRAEHDACVDGHELFAFINRHKEAVWWDIAFRQIPSESAEPGYVVFGDVLDGWKALLGELGFEED